MSNKAAPYLLTALGALAEGIGAPISAVFLYSLCVMALYVQYFFEEDDEA